MLYPLLAILVASDQTPNRPVTYSGTSISLQMSTRHREGHMASKKVLILLILGVLSLAISGCWNNPWGNSSDASNRSDAPMGEEELSSVSVTFSESTSYKVFLEPRASRGEVASQSNSYRLASGKLIAE